MARRKTVVAKTGAELSLEDARADARKDRPRQSSRGLLPTLAEWREARGMMTAAELLSLAKSAARLELRGAMYSADDRLDVAASIVAAVLADTGGACPRRESDRVKLGRLCGDAKNYRRSIDATRERDQANANKRAAEHAQTAAALGADPTPAKHAAIVARAGELAAERAASAICAELGLPAEPDGAAWSMLYQWARGATGEVCAAERGATWACWKVRTWRGAKFIRGFYSATALMAKLTLGACECELPCDECEGACECVPTTEVVFTLQDDSREAHGRTPLLAVAPLAPHWREPTYSRPADVSEARASCHVSKMTAAERVHWRRRREHRREHAAQVAAALGRIGRAYAVDAARTGRRERTAERSSALPSIA